jgi:hypothetical protein
MRLFAIRIEHAGVIAVDCLQRRHAREKHPRDLPLRRVRQDLRRCQNFRHALLCLGHRLGEIGDGLLKRRKREAVRQRNRVVKFAGPAPFFAWAFD